MQTLSIYIDSKIFSWFLKYLATYYYSIYFSKFESSTFNDYSGIYNFILYFIPSLIYTKIL